MGPARLVAQGRPFATPSKATRIFELIFVLRAGNKTSGSMEHDSTMGKLMEMSGKIVHNDGMVEKGHARREAAGAFDESS